MIVQNSSTILRSHSPLFLLTLLAAFGTAQAVAAAGRAQGQATVPAPAQAAPVQLAPQSPSVCGSQPLCAETSDFAATITDFRTSTLNYLKVIDVVLRFQNKTSQPIILGYVDGSAQATDDQGNRYGLFGNGQGVRGMGIISGNNLDAKFVLQPGGAGDARFELVWHPGQEVQGATFELYVTIREANPAEGKQYVLDGEFPFHYQGLVNGAGAAVSSANASGPGLVAGAAPAMAGVGGMTGGGVAAGAAQPGCTPASNAASTITDAANSVGSQNQKAAGAASTISGAASAMSSLGSLFNRKKATAAAPQGTTGAPPCPPGSTGDASAVSTVASTAGGAVPQAAGGASSVPAVASSVAGTSTPVAGAASPAAGAVAPSGTITQARRQALGVASPVAGAVAPGVAPVGNPCAGRQHCYSAGAFTAEVSSIAANRPAPPQDHVVQLTVNFRNVTNQPIVLAYKGTTSQLKDNLGHAYYWGRAGERDTNPIQAPFVLNPGQVRNAVFVVNAFDRGQNPLGTSFTYGVVIDQMQVLQNRQVQVLREYPLNFSGLALPGAATPAQTTRAAASTPVQAASPAVKRPAATTVPKK